jgi:hypothetical protein
MLSRFVELFWGLSKGSDFPPGRIPMRNCIAFDGEWCSAFEYDTQGTQPCSNEKGVRSSSRVLSTGNHARSFGTVAPTSEVRQESSYIIILHKK